jgi:hypothetical protein
MGIEHIEMRLHEAILYNSIYHADGEPVQDQDGGRTRRTA